MKHYKSGDSWTLIFNKGEPFIATMTEFCHKQRIKAGFFHGLGGVLSAEIGYYHLDRKEYEFRKLDEVLEIASLHGSVALKDDELFIHAHGVFSDTDLCTYGGHIREMVVGGTLELQLQSLEGSWARQLDEDTGLSLINFDESA
ncbi:MAG: PPC domain-containing DNA-binding protein [Candidatus Saccharimonadales bacterium]